MQMKAFCDKFLSPMQNKELQGRIDEKLKAVRARTAWRIEGTLREFPKFEPINLWFDYPIHRADDSGVLKDIQPEEALSLNERAAQKRKKQAEKDRVEKLNKFETVFLGVEVEGKASARELAEKLNTPSKTLLSWFGNGQKQNKNLKQDYEKYEGDDGKAYIRRREKSSAPD